MTFVVDVRDLLEDPGSSRRLTVAEPVEALASAMATVPEGEPVRAQVLLESVVEGILVTGTVTGPLELTCARCLKQFRSEFGLDPVELFAPGATIEDDEYPIVEGFVDLEPMIHDAVLLAMPFAPLCRQECLGLCDRCGGDRNAGECSCPPEVDERWAPLLDLRLEPENRT